MAFSRVRVYACTRTFVSVHLSHPPKDQMTQLGVCPRVWHDARPQPWLARRVFTSPLGRAAGWGVLFSTSSPPLPSSPLTVPLFSPRLSSGLAGKGGTNQYYTYGEILSHSKYLTGGSHVIFTDFLLCWTGLATGQRLRSATWYHVLKHP